MSPPKKYLGKSIFFFQGRVLTGPDYRQLLLTLTLIFIPTILYSVFEGPWLSTEISPAIPVIFYVLLFICISSLLATSFSDPGIIPRDITPNRVDPNLVVSNQDIEQNGLPAGYPFGELKPIVYENYQVNGVEVKNKFCATCQLARPPRASHCGICDNCVERFDHHCPWVGNCIGKRNHRTFTMFAVSCFLLIGLVLASSITDMVVSYFRLPDDPNRTFLSSLANRPVAMILGIYTFFLIWSLGGLSFMHVYLAFLNLTTNEQIKNVLKKNPYSNGAINNFLHFFCGPRFPSWLDRGGVSHEVEDLEKQSLQGQGSARRTQESEKQPLVPE